MKNGCTMNVYFINIIVQKVQKIKMKYNEYIKQKYKMKMKNESTKSIHLYLYEITN